LVRADQLEGRVPVMLESPMRLMEVREVNADQEDGIVPLNPPLPRLRLVKVVRY
jgi:hypothetical protein